MSSSTMHICRWMVVSGAWLQLAGFMQGGEVASADEAFTVTASSSTDGSSPASAVDGDRFLAEESATWKGCSNDGPWWWQVEFERPRQIGAILQIVGDHARNFRGAPLRYVWQFSENGKNWKALQKTATSRERRMYRVHRLPHPVTTRFLRMTIFESLGDSPVLREIEFYPETTSNIDFKDWIVSVSSRENSNLSTDPCRFTQLVRQCENWSHVEVQYIWHGDFDEDLVSAEPRPLCAFLSGSHLEWCQRSREPWRGVQQVLSNGNLPMWGACGGAQILAILEETGVDKPWDCPRCRSPESPKLPVYSHIGHLGESKCGDYSKCIGERGKFKMQSVARDPVLAGLPEVFDIMESHIGQIAFVPEGWARIVTKGPGAHTVNQCIRVKDRPIYAAQFHMELPGTEENSRTLMSNFLRLAKDWGGYNPTGQPLLEPQPIQP